MGGWCSGVVVWTTWACQGVRRAAGGHGVRRGARRQDVRRTAERQGVTRGARRQSGSWEARRQGVRRERSVRRRARGETSVRLAECCESCVGRGVRMPESSFFLRLMVCLCFVLLLNQIDRSLEQICSVGWLVNCW